MPTNTNIAERLRTSFKNKKFKEKIKKFTRLNNAGQFSCTELASEIDDYTLIMIESSGFNVKKVTLYGSYAGYNISWQNEYE